MTTKPKGDSVRQRLVVLSAKLGAAYPNIETAFLIERLVVRLLTDKKLSQRLVFKGGFVGLRVYDSGRYTVDLDALLVNADVESALTRAKEKAETDIDDGVWFRFESQTDLDTQGEYGGVRQVYRAGIGEVLSNLKKAQTVHFDMGIGDPITPGPVHTETPSFLLNNDDFSWSVYPVETIVAEKLHALIAHGDVNSRSKDVHDLSIFLRKSDPIVLSEAIKRCFTFRETKLPRSFSGALKKINTTALSKGWRTAVASVKNAPEFDVAFSDVIKLISKTEKLSGE
jgi:predicted nucleotidyltransferase component of viral defense system